MLAWAETTLYDIGRALQDYKEGGEDVSLFEARLATDTLDTLITEVVRRENDQA